MMRRGLSMVEMLLAIALLAMVMVASAQWLSVAAATQGEHVRDLQWRHAAERTLALIHDAIRAGDDIERSPDERVQVTDNVLTITTRSIAGHGPEQHRYVLDGDQAVLEVAIRPSQGQDRRRPLIGSVRDWTVTLDPETHILIIEITSTTGQTRTRRYQP